MKRSHSRLILFFIHCIAVPVISVSSVLADSIVNGVVIDFVTREPLLGANVFVPDLITGTSTDETGSFRLRIPANKRLTIEISFIGYEKKEIDLELAENEERFLTVYLSPGALRLGDVTVVGSKISETVFNSSNFVSVATKEEINTANYTTTADILQNEPGILIQKTTHAHGAPVIRGLLGKYVLLLYNGIRLNKPTFRFGANQYLNTVDTESLRTIEITRGPTSVLYGSDAIGGTVNLVTEYFEPDGDRFRIVPEVKFGYASADNSKNASVRVMGSKSAFSFYGNILYKEVNDLDPGGDARKQVPTGWDELDGSFNVFFEPDEVHTFSLDYLNVSQKDVPRYDKYAPQPDYPEGEFQKWIYDPQDRRLYGLTYTFSPALSWLHRLKWNVSYQNEQEGRTQQKFGSAQTRVDTDFIETFGSFVNFSSILKDKHWMNWGVEYYLDLVGSTREIEENGAISFERGAFPDDSEYRSLGVFVQDNYIMTDRLELEAGLRYSFYSYESQLEEPFGLLDENLNNLTGFASIKYRLVPKLNIVGTFARGFRAPNFNDTVVLQFSNSGVDAPSPGLDPEISKTFELGLKVSDTNLQAGWFVYFNRMTDLIDRRFGTYAGLTFFDDNGNGVRDSNEGPVFQKFNIGTANIFGTEMYANYTMNGLEWSGQLFFTHGENTTDNEPLSRIPPITGQAGLRWYRSDQWLLEAQFRFAGKQDRLSQRDILDSRIPVGGTPGYKSVDLKSVFTIPSGRLVLSFDNIFDELYRTHGSGIYSPGRNVALSLRFNPFFRE